MNTPPNVAKATQSFCRLLLNQPTHPPTLPTCAQACWRSRGAWTRRRRCPCCPLLVRLPCLGKRARKAGWKRPNRTEEEEEEKEDKTPCF